MAVKVANTICIEDRLWQSICYCNVDKHFYVNYWCNFDNLIVSEELYF